MITLKSSHEIQLMRQAGKITAAARALAGAMVAPGVTTQEIDRAVHRFIKSKGAEPSFLGYNGYPASAEPMPISIPPSPLTMIKIISPCGSSPFFCFL